MVKIKRAIISVSDKTGIVDFAKGLEKMGVEIISTGGTLSLLHQNKVKAMAMSSFTKFPEILEGRVKTLHPKIHGGLLYRREKKSHAAEAKKHGIAPIDMVVVNLYPFEQTTKNKDVSLEDAIEQIDIGGPSMLRSAAKNFKSVAVVSDPADYPRILEDMKSRSGKVSDEIRYELARKVFKLTSYYDSVIASFLESQNGKHDVLPAAVQHRYVKQEDLRYGENPHQRAALYAPASGSPAMRFKKLHGKELSYNNLIDMEAAWDVVQEFDQPAACVIKHNTPCGIAEAKNLPDAAVYAIEGDPEAAFGGIIGLNRPCDLKTAEAILNKLSFFEVIIAPEFAPKAAEALMARKNLRLVETEVDHEEPLSHRFTKMGLLVQDVDKPLRGAWNEFKAKTQCVTKKKPSPSDLEELFFAWRCVKVVKSNGIVITAGRRAIGIGAGQMSRVDAVRIACAKAGDKAKGSFLGSDAFFPMPDSIGIAAACGVKAIVQPGGSIRDKEVIEACDHHGITMVVTGSRHFRH